MPSDVLEGPKNDKGLLRSKRLRTSSSKAKIYEDASEPSESSEQEDSEKNDNNLSSRRYAKLRSKNPQDQKSRASPPPESVIDWQNFRKKAKDAWS